MKSREIKKALTKAFKGIKFSVTTCNVLCETITVSWEGGPFINQVKEITAAWDTFENHSDPMTDYFSYEGTKIEFNRSYTDEELEFLAVAIPELKGLSLDGYNVLFSKDYLRFYGEGLEPWDRVNCPLHCHNKALRDWLDNGLAVSLEQSPAAIQARQEAYEAECKAISDAKKTEIGELIEGDYDGIPANENLDHIVIHWHEGYQVIKEDSKFKSFKSAHNAILKICDHNWWGENMGYYKLRFSIVFTDGEVYTGRLDLSPREDNPFATDNIIGKHCVDSLNYLISQGEEGCQEYLDKYSFSDPVDNSDNQAIASEWLLDEDAVSHVVSLAETVTPDRLNQIFSEVAESKNANAGKDDTLQKYTKWVSDKVATGQHSKIITFDDWLEIYTMA